MTRTAILCFVSLLCIAYCPCRFCFAQVTAARPSEQDRLSKLRKAVQKKFAVSKLLKGTRVDRIDDFDNKPLRFTGVTWDPEGIPRRDRPGDIRFLLSKAILEEIAENFPKYQKRARVIVDDIDEIESPLLSIRKLVEKNPKLDGVRIDKASYDGAGAIVFHGIRCKDEQKEFLLGMLDQESANSDAWEQWIGTASKPKVVWDYLLPLDKIKAGLEGAFQRAILSTHTLQYNVNSIEKDLFDKILIERIYYNLDNQLCLKGVRWNELTDPDEDALEKRRRQIVLDVVKQNWPKSLRLANSSYANENTVNLNGVSPFNTSELKRRSPLAFLWDLIPRHPELDGIRVDRAYYKDGVLHFTGIQATPEQTIELRKLVDKLLHDSDDPNHELWNRLAPRGVKFIEFDLVLTRDLRSRLQIRFAANKKGTEGLNGAKIRRIYYQFDAELKKLRPTFEIEQWRGSDSSLIEQTIIAELDDNRKKWSQIRKWGEPDFLVIATRDNLLSILNNEISARRDLDGVRLDRAFYGQDGRLRFGGLLGREKQLKLLEQLVLATVDRNQHWQEHVSGDWSLRQEHFKLWPIDPLLACIQNVLPGYEELDGASVTRIYHLADGELALDGRVTHRDQIGSLSRILSRELSRVEHGRVRLEKNSPNGMDYRVVKTTKFEIFPVKRDFHQAHSIVGSAWPLYWKKCYAETIEQLDMALIYDPKCIGAWYLRALCYIELKKMPLARRDIRRSVMLTQDSPYREKSRYAYLSRVQGKKRICFEKLFQEALLSRRNGSLISDICIGCDCYGKRSNTCLRCQGERKPASAPCPHPAVGPCGLGCISCKMISK